MNVSDELSDALPPITSCPPWCAGGFHGWEPTPHGAEFYREHILGTGSGGHRVELFQFDGWLDGERLAGDHGRAVGGDAMTVEEAEDLAARLQAAISAARLAQPPA